MVATLSARSFTPQPHSACAGPEDAVSASLPERGCPVPPPRDSPIPGCGRLHAGSAPASWQQTRPEPQPQGEPTREMAPLWEGLPACVTTGAASSPSPRSPGPGRPSPTWPTRRPARARRVCKGPTGGILTIRQWPARRPERRCGGHAGLPGARLRRARNVDMNGEYRVDVHGPRTSGSWNRLDGTQVGELHLELVA